MCFEHFPEKIDFFYEIIEKELLCVLCPVIAQANNVCLKQTIFQKGTLCVASKSRILGSVLPDFFFEGAKRKR